MITLKDIAKEAGVSLTTVSNVINGKKSKVSQQTIDKIQTIIQRENYIPSMSARSLANNSSNIIGIINQVVPSKAGSFLGDPFHSSIIGGIEERVRERGYFLMLRTVEDGKSLEQVCRNWNLDGLIFTGLFDDKFLDAVIKLNIPFVLIDSYVNRPGIFNVGLEDRYGAYIATKYLLDKGHRQIAFASPYIKKGGVLEHRLNGYKKALTEFNIKFNPSLVFEQEITTDNGIKLGIRLSQNESITGIFASADILAAGIMSGLNEMGVSIPENKSVIGFDDIYLSRLTSPQLTTIHQDVEDKGLIAAELLINQLVNGRNSNGRNIILPVKLIERDTVKSIL
ncbi:MAG: LacI family transcriptional regulator [Clostridiales bacterium]|nr:LacI family transcriptional regulator [Clostridiales bacterium]